MYAALFIVSLKCDTNEFVALVFSAQIVSCFVILFYCIQQVLIVFLSNIFYTKVVHNQCETKRSQLVRPDARDVLTLMVSCGVESFF